MKQSEGSRCVGVLLNPKFTLIDFVVKNKISFHYEPWNKLINYIVYQKKKWSKMEAQGAIVMIRHVLQYLHWGGRRCENMH